MESLCLSDFLSATLISSLGNLSGDGMPWSSEDDRSYIFLGIVSLVSLKGNERLVLPGVLTRGVLNDSASSTELSIVYCGDSLEILLTKGTSCAHRSFKLPKP